MKELGAGPDAPRVRAAGRVGWGREDRAAGLDSARYLGVSVVLHDADGAGDLLETRLERGPTHARQHREHERHLVAYACKNHADAGADAVPMPMPNEPNVLSYLMQRRCSDAKAFRIRFALVRSGPVID